MAMVDEGLNEYLQIGIINYLTQKQANKPEEVQKLLDSLGYRIGYTLIEKMFPDTFRLNDDISAMKYICKEFWTSMFSKQIDNLRTNNSGIFVLQDNSFKLLAQFNSNEETANDNSKKYMAFVCGLLRGVLANMGYQSIITYDFKSAPCCKFQINFINQQQQINAK